jgi:hypothetical protein
MTESPVEDDDAQFRAPGSRWGTGARSVLPYLARTLQARPAAAAEAREAHASEAKAPRPHDGRPSA